MDADRNTLVQELGRGDAVAIASLRATDIPQRVGMAAAARVLAQDISRAAVEHIEALRSDRTLHKRFEDHGAQEDVAVELLRELVARIASRIQARGEAWLDESLRLEGQVVALEDRISRLMAAASANREEAAG